MGARCGRADARTVGEEPYRVARRGGAVGEGGGGRQGDGSASSGGGGETESDIVEELSAAFARLA